MKLGWRSNLATRYCSECPFAKELIRIFECWLAALFYRTLLFSGSPTENISSSFFVTTADAVLCAATESSCRVPRPLVREEDACRCGSVVSRAVSTGAFCKTCDYRLAKGIRKYSVTHIRLLPAAKLRRSMAHVCRLLHLPTLRIFD